jgi:hypothetical protein
MRKVMVWYLWVTFTRSWTCSCCVHSAFFWNWHHTCLLIVFVDYSLQSHRVCLEDSSSLSASMHWTLNPFWIPSMLQLSPHHAPVLVTKDWIIRGTFWTSMELGVSISGLQGCSSAVSKLGLCWSSLYWHYCCNFQTTSRHVDARGSLGLKPQASSTMIGVWGGSFLSNVSTADIRDTHWYCPPQTLGLFFILNMSTWVILCPCWQKTHRVEEWQIPERGSAPSTPGKRSLVMLTLAVVFMLSIVCFLCGQTGNQFPTWFDCISLLMFSSTAGTVGTSIVIRDSNHITYMYDLPCIPVWVSDH